MEIVTEKMRQFADTVQSSHMNASGQQKKEEVSAKQSEAAYSAVSSQGDTLYISESGRSAFANNNRENDQSEADGKVILKSAVKSSSETNDSPSTTDLSSCTETELKQMYLNGDITKSEYDEEVKSRGTEVF